MLSGAQVTQLGPDGGPGLRYGSFASGKVTPTKSYTATFTRHGIDGTAGIPYGNFAGKSPGTPFALEVSAAVGLGGVLTATSDIQVSFSWEFEPPLEIPQFTGAMSLSGDIQITATALNLVASAIGITGALTTSGSLQWVQNLATSPVTVGGVLSLTGDIQVVPGEPFNLVTTAVPMTGTVGTAANVQIGTSFNLVTFPVFISGVTTIFGNLDNIEFGSPFELGAVQANLSGLMSITGNIDAGTVYTKDSRTRIGVSGKPVAPKRIGKATAPVPRRRVGPRRL